MKIQSTSSTTSSALSTQNTDSAIEALQKQVESLQKQLESVSKNTKLSPKELAEKKKALEDQITQINQQIIEKQAEAQRKEQIEQAQKLQEQTGTANTEPEDQNDIGFSKTEMQAVVSVTSLMGQASSINHVRTQMTGSAHELKGTIAVIESRGGDATELKSQLTDLEKQIDKVAGKVISKYGEAQKILKNTFNSDDANTASGSVKDKKDSEGNGETGQVNPAEGNSAESSNQQTQVDQAVEGAQSSTNGSKVGPIENQ